MTQKKIAQLKRLFEWVAAEPALREAATKNRITAPQLAYLKKIGVPFEASEMAFLSEITDFGDIFSLDRKIAPENLQRALQYPLFSLWLDYAGRIREGKSRGQLTRIPRQPGFDAWRMRRLAAAISELGGFGAAVSQPPLAFELSDGCSIGCWFCGFAVDKLRAVLDYHTYQTFFCSIIRQSFDLFGPEQAEATLLYYGSEPYDNPNYLEFMSDYEAIAGIKPFTSTAAAHDAAWVRRLINNYRTESDCKLRISVLSLAMLQQIHETYPPEELLNVALALKMKESPLKKVDSGRILKEHKGLRGDAADKNPHHISVPQGSISCVNGFVINLVKRTIKLVSPCYACKKWPFGYRVFDSASFGSADDYTEIIQKMIARNVFMVPPSDQKLRFRDDLEFRPSVNGFDLIAPNQIHHFDLPEKLKPLGGLIAAGDKAYARVETMLKKESAVNPMVAAAAIQKLFDGGFLDEVYE